MKKQILKMRKVESLITLNLSKVSLDELKGLKKEYFSLMKENPFPIPPSSGGVFEMINYFKRKDQSIPSCIGPYKNITVFEAANRICSDLVIINGIFQLINENNLKIENVSLRLGATHQKDRGDFTLKVKSREYEGEAFNVSPTFLTSKLSATIKKWSGDDRLKYILVNEEAFEFEPRKLDKRVFKVSNWQE